MGATSAGDEANAGAADPAKIQPHLTGKGGPRPAYAVHPSKEAPGSQLRYALFERSRAVVEFLNVRRIAFSDALRCVTPKATAGFRPLLGAAVHPAVARQLRATELQLTEAARAARRPVAGPERAR